MTTLILSKTLALDLGTTKFCLAAIKKETPESLPQLEIISIPAQGMYRGMLSNLKEATEALKELLTVAEKQLGTDVSEVVVGVAGSHLRSQRVIVELYNPHPSLIGETVLHQLEEKAKIQGFKEDKDILHLVPINYTIDDRIHTKNPNGFSFKKIVGEFFILQADKLYLIDIVRVCNEAGLEVKKLYAEPFASASVILSQKVKDQGVIIADIGGGTTDALVFKRGDPVDVFTINIAGKIMSNDLAIGLGISFDVAEQIKRTYGLQQSPPYFVDVIDLYKRPKRISGEMIFNILSARVRELAELIKQASHTHTVSLRSGLILTGGGSEVLGLTSLLEKFLSYSVGKANPQIPTHLYKNVSYTSSLYEPEEHETKYATSLGLLYLETIRQEANKKPENLNKINKFFKSFFDWMKELS